MGMHFCLGRIWGQTRGRGGVCKNGDLNGSVNVTAELHGVNIHERF